jgi:hypothetical protein
VPRPSPVRKPQSIEDRLLVDTGKFLETIGWTALRVVDLALLVVAGLVVADPAFLFFLVFFRVDRAARIRCPPVFRSVIPIAAITFAGATGLLGFLLGHKVIKLVAVIHLDLALHPLDPGIQFRMFLVVSAHVQAAFLVSIVSIQLAVSIGSVSRTRSASSACSRCLRS